MNQSKTWIYKQKKLTLLMYDYVLRKVVSNCIKKFDHFCDPSSSKAPFSGITQVIETTKFTTSKLLITSLLGL